MRNYYYFVATLPSINYGDEPPMSSAAFRELCDDLLEPPDAALLAYCTYDPKTKADAAGATGSEFIDLFIARERTLILNLAYLRAERLKRASPGDPPHDVPRAEAVAKSAFAMDDPLQAELSIDRARWGALDAMVGIDLFGVNNIFAYLLKLQLLERKRHFVADKGMDAYRSRYDAILAEGGWG